MNYLFGVLLATAMLFANETLEQNTTKPLTKTDASTKQNSTVPSTQTNSSTKLNASLAKPIVWKSFDEGFEAMQKRKNMMLIYIKSDWCRYCKRMDENVFSQSDVQEVVNANFIPVMVNTSRGEHLPIPVELRGVPAFVFVNSKKEVRVLPGSVPKEGFLEILEEVKQFK